MVLPDRQRKDSRLRCPQPAAACLEPRPLPRLQPANAQNTQICTASASIEIQRPSAQLGGYFALVGVLAEQIAEATALARPGQEGGSAMMRS